MFSGKGGGSSKTTRTLAQKQPFVQRVRNSSLVERFCAENVRGLNTSPKLWNRRELLLVEEHCFFEEAILGRGRGEKRRENAGMSSERKVRILPAESPRFPESS